MNNYKIFVNEVLIRCRVLLFKKVCVVVKIGYVFFCWINDGKIIVKFNNDKKIIICFEEDVDKFLVIGKFCYLSYVVVVVCNVD